RIPLVAPKTWTIRVEDGTGLYDDSSLFVPPPSLGLSDSLGSPGASFTVRLRGFRSAEQVAIRWYGVGGTTFRTLATVTVSATGSADEPVTSPATALEGGHRVEGLGQTSGYRAESVFSTTASGAIRYLTQGSSGCKRIAFIFNVGVGYPLDTGVLATLKTKSVPATMFPMGWWADANPTMMKRLMTDGYVTIIGSHGYGSRELTTLSDSAVVSDIQKAGQAIERITGAPPGPWFTPYAAAIDTRVKNLIAGQGYTPVGWKISARDYGSTATESEVYSRVVNNAYDGAIVEFHIDGPATSTSTGRALPRIIDTLRGRGYRFVTIPQMAMACSALPPGSTAINSDLVRRSVAVLPSSLLDRSAPASQLRRRRGVRGRRVAAR
ncbi:MAG TPA: polysaccharide deacetylase family protein, partial [Thermomicrobiales bacterium]|nr:polysaccharide deacetylase family protein [Thermomicrobiales bacterium]